MSFPVPFADEDQGLAVHETADVVDVAVGVIAHGSFAQPENIGHPQVLFQRGFDLFFAEAGIADLNLRVEDNIARWR